jgi:hypothetical protein
MDTVAILRSLRSKPRLVGGAALLAVLVGFLLTYKPSLPPEPRRHTVGVAAARVLLDTPKSQVVEITPRGSETLPSRASLLANIMVEGRVKASIARQADLQPKQLLATTDSAMEPVSVPAGAANNPNAHLLTTGVVINQDGVQLPIIKIEARAPTVTGAVKLADAAVMGLRDYLESKAAAEQLSFARRLSVGALGGAQGSEEVRGPGPLIGLIVVIFVFLTGCGAILLGSALRRGWNQAGVGPALQGEAAPDGFVRDPLGDAAATWLDPDHESGLDAKSGDSWLDMPDSELALGSTSRDNGDARAGDETSLKWS